MRVHTMQPIEFQFTQNRMIWIRAPTASSFSIGTQKSKCSDLRRNATRSCEYSRWKQSICRWLDDKFNTSSSSPMVGYVFRTYLSTLIYIYAFGVCVRASETFHHFNLIQCEWKIYIWKLNLKFYIEPLKHEQLLNSDCKLFHRSLRWSYCWRILHTAHCA